MASIRDKLEFMVGKDSFIVLPVHKDTYTITCRESNIYAVVDLTDEDNPEVNYYLSICSEMRNACRIPVGYAIELRDFIDALKHGE